MGAINGARYLGLNEVELPAEVYGYIKRVSIREAERRGYWSEAEALVKSLGHPKGMKNFSGRAYNEKDIERLFLGLGAIHARSVAAAHYVSVSVIAGDFLKKVVKSRGKFNNYTGNLMNAYSATAIYGRKLIDTMYYDYQKNKVLRSKTGKRYAELQQPPNHPLSRKKRNKRNFVGRKIRKIRYLRNFELNDGYRKWSMSGGSKGSKVSVGYSQQGAGGGKLQSAIVIENTAPYADMVNRRYRVLQNSSAKIGMNRWGSQYSKLMRIAPIDALRKAGFKVKK